MRYEPELRSSTTNAHEWTRIPKVWLPAARTRIFRPRFVFIGVHSWFRTKSLGPLRSSGSNHRRSILSVALPKIRFPKSILSLNPTVVIHGEVADKNWNPAQELALVYWVSARSQTNFDTRKQAALMASMRVISDGELNFSVSTLTGTFATNSMGTASVNTVRNAPRNTASGTRAMLNRL